MGKYVVMINQPAMFETDNLDEAYAFAEDLASKSPGVSYDVLEHLSQSFAPVPEPVLAIAETKSVSTGEKITVNRALPVDVIADK